MKVVSVIASPRKNGNCSTLVNTMTEEFEKESGTNNIYFVDDLDISPCQACRACRNPEKPSKCVIDDDFMKIMEEVENSDAFIFAVPNYFSEINAQGHIFMDRFYSMTKKTPNQIKADVKAVIIYTYGAKTNSKHYEYINKRANIFRSIGLDVVEVLAVGENLPTQGDNREILEKVRKIARSL